MPVSGGFAFSGTSAFHHAPRPRMGGGGKLRWRLEPAPVFPYFCVLPDFHAPEFFRSAGTGPVPVLSKRPIAGFRSRFPGNRWCVLLPRQRPLTR